MICVKACPEGEFAATDNCSCVDCDLEYGEHCLECDNKKCTVCDENSYIETGACHECAEGYYVLNNSCRPCEDITNNCSLCTSSPLACIGCRDGYYLNSANCKTCSSAITGCTKCSSATECTSCADGYYLDGSTCKACSDSISNCNTCSNGSTCTSCASGYDVSEGGCISSLPSSQTFYGAGITLNGFCTLLRASGKYYCMTYAEGNYTGQFCRERGYSYASNTASNGFTVCSGVTSEVECTYTIHTVYCKR